MDTEKALEHAVAARKVYAQCRSIAAAKNHLEQAIQKLEEVVKGPPFGEQITRAFGTLDRLELDLPAESSRERAIDVALGPFRDISLSRLDALRNEAETQGQALALRWLMKELDHVEDPPVDSAQEES